MQPSPNNEPGKIVVLIALLFLTVLYCYFSFLVLPLNAEARTLRQNLQKLQTASHSDSVELKKLKAAEQMEEEKSSLQAASEKLRSSIPASHLISVPPAILGTLAKHDLTNAKATLALVLPFEAIPDYLLDGWNVRVNGANPLRVGEVVRDLENQFLLSQITALEIQSETATGAVSADFTIQLLAIP